MLTVVFAVDITMDVKFRKLFNTISSGYAFTGSFPWVHFNVFTVSERFQGSSKNEGSMGILDDDMFVYLQLLEEKVAWLCLWYNVFEI